MPVYSFSVVLRGIDVISDDLAETLFAAGCDDGSPFSADGVAEVGFDREADSLESAIRSAIADVQKAGCVVEKVEIESEALA
jgi:hypothetical protein